MLTDAFPIGIDPDFWAEQLDTVEVKDMIISLQVWAKGGVLLSVLAKGGVLAKCSG